MGRGHTSVQAVAGGDVGAYDPLRRVRETCVPLASRVQHFCQRSPHMGWEPLRRMPKNRRTYDADDGCLYGCGCGLGLGRDSQGRIGGECGVDGRGLGNECGLGPGLWPSDSGGYFEARSLASEDGPFVSLLHFFRTTIMIVAAYNPSLVDQPSI